jgi:hypothetical protein
LTSTSRKTLSTDTASKRSNFQSFETRMKRILQLRRPKLQRLSQTAETGLPEYRPDDFCRLAERWSAGSEISTLRDFIL